jgi:hypothetical protein
VKPEAYEEEKVHELYDTALKRRHSYTGKKITIGSLVYEAMKNGYGQQPNSSDSVTLHRPFDLGAARPIYYPMGILPREFVGPSVGEAKLFPKGAVSIFVALGSGGKTTTLISMACHIAAGKKWGESVLYPAKIIIFCVEETQEELNRKFCAATHHFIDKERSLVEANLRLVSCVDRDPRLTFIQGRQIVGSGLADQMIVAAKEFQADLIIIDHIQGFTSGDLNNSDTATALGQQANKMADQTGAAVVLAAHTTKMNVGAGSVTAGFTTGSFAFENFARQVTGIILLPDDDVKKYGLERVRDNYRRIEVSKNSYGPSGSVGYLQKARIDIFHSVTFLPYEPQLAAPHGIVSRQDRLRSELVRLIRESGGLPPTKIDELSGNKGHLKASKAQVGAALRALIDDGEVKAIEPSQAQRKELGLNRQVRKVLVATASMSAIKPAEGSPPDLEQTRLEG